MDLPRSSISFKQDLRALPFVAPFLAVFLVFIAYPVVYSLWISFHQITLYSDFYDVFGTMRYVGIDNYTRVLADAVFWWSVALTIAYSALTIVPGIALSLALALLLNRRIRGGGLFRAGFYLPNVYDVYVVGVIWLLLFNPNGGVFSAFLSWIGLGRFAANGVLNNPYTTLPAIALAMILKNAGFGMILFLVSLNTISASVFEAADVDGASAWQKLRHVTLPLLRPVILFLVITGLMSSLNAFSEIYALTDDTGGPSIQVFGQTLQAARTSGYHLYKVFDSSMYGNAAAISFVLLLIALAISYVNYRTLIPKD